MPEIGEVARTVHYLRKHLLDRTITSVTAHDDPIVYGKVGTSASAFETAVKGRRVIDAAQQGKYFYLLFDKPPHAVMHFGMTGWMKFDAEDTAYYKQAKVPEGEGGEAKEEWPPKYVKFLLRCEKEGERAAVEAAFVDARRLARIRLVDCEADKIRNTSPLEENGPDPVRDKDILTKEWLAELLGKKRVPIKALLLDQANISGVGNWVADEVLYQACIHPEQYSNSFSSDQTAALHAALLTVCTTAVETLADSTKFPETWLMKYRWDKGKKEANVLPNGEKIVHLKVGGRTSAVVLSRQKLIRAVAGSGEDGEEESEEGQKKKGTARGKRRKTQDAEEEGDGEKLGVALPVKPEKKTKTKKPAKEEPKDAEPQATGGAEKNEPSVKPEKKSAPKKEKEAPAKKVEKPPTPGSRRSSRNR